MWFDLLAQTVLDLLCLKEPNWQNYKTLGLDSVQTMKLAQCNIQFTSLASNDFCFVVLFLLLFAFIHLFVYLFILFIYLSTYLSNHLLTYSFIYFLEMSFFQDIYIGTQIKYPLLVSWICLYFFYAQIWHGGRNHF